VVDRFELVTVLFFLQNSGSEGGSSLQGEANLRLGLERLARMPQAARREIVGHLQVSAYPLFASAHYGSARLCECDIHPSLLRSSGRNGLGEVQIP
jgi:hypothetical protein